MIKNILIIEDEKPNADRLKRLICAVKPDSMVLKVLESVSETVAWLSENETPDLIMMDVRLPDGLSFEVFEQIKVNCPIIFTTAYDEYAVKAFKFNSIDYLLKPVEQDELQHALTVAESRHQIDHAVTIENLLAQLTKKEYRTRFLLPYRDGYKTVLIGDVDYFHSESRITKARLSNGTDEVISQTLEELEQQLDPKSFLRVNRQFILCIESIRRIHNYHNGKLKVELRKYPDIEIIVSRDRAALIKTWMDF